MIIKKVNFKARTNDGKSKADFKRLSDYVLDRKSNNSNSAELINYMLDKNNDMNKVHSYEFTNCSFKDIDSNIQEIVETQSLNTRAKEDKTMHLIVSFQEDEHPPKETLKAIEEEIAASLGMPDNQRLSVVHDNTNNLHIHIAINKVHPTTHNVINPYNDVKILQELAIKLERKYGLKVDNHISNKDKMSNQYSHDMTVEFDTWVKDKVYSHIDGILNDTNSNLNDIHDLLNEYDLELRERRKGFVVSSKSDKYFCKASSVHRGLSKQQLEKRYGKEAIKEHRNTTQNNTITKQKYTPYTKDQKELYQQYQKLQENRKQELTKMKLQRQEFCSLLKSKKYNPKFKIMRKNFNEQMKLKRDKLFDKNRNFREFLINEALDGNEIAIKALARKKAIIDRNDNNIYSNVNRAKLFKGANYITKEGYAIYKHDDNNKIIDKNEFIKVNANKTNKEFILDTLLLSIDRFGKELNITGTNDFKMTVLDVVNEYNLDVRFIDSSMEQINQSNKASKIEDIKRQTIVEAIAVKLEEIQSNTNILDKKRDSDIKDLDKISKKLEYFSTKILYKNDFAKIGLDYTTINEMETMDVNLQINSFIINDKNLVGIKAINEELLSKLEGSDLKKLKEYIADIGSSKITNIPKSFYTTKDIDLEKYIEQYNMELSKVDKTTTGIDISSAKNQEILTKYINHMRENIQSNKKGAKKTILDTINIQQKLINNSNNILPSEIDNDISILNRLTYKIKDKNTQALFKNEVAQLGIDRETINNMDMVDVDIKVDSFIANDKNLAGMRAIHEDIKKTLQGEELKKFEKWIYVFNSGDKISDVTKAFYTNKNIDINKYIETYDMSLSKVDKVNKAIDINSAKNQEIFKKHINTLNQKINDFKLSPSIKTQEKKQQDSSIGFER